MKPNEIEEESFRIILEELGPHRFSDLELPIVQRVIHATGDFEYAERLAFSPWAIADGLAALRKGCPILTDVSMVAAGINQKALEKLGGSVRCRIDESETARQAQEKEMTRSAVAIQRMAPELTGAIVAIGNAPTALLELLRLAEEKSIRPALVIGVPVGFVSAVESKEALKQADLSFITTTGRKGGSTVAAAIVNALLRMAGD